MKEGEKRAPDYKKGRVAVYVNDLAMYLGKSERTAYRMIVHVRKELGILRPEPLKIEDFVAVYDWKYEILWGHLNG